MMYNTHYYWRIIAWDSYDASTTGPIWDFTTGEDIPNNPPDPPSDPDPEDGATDVDINADLSWTCSDPDGDDLVYDVYFEANDPDPGVKVSDDQTETTYDPGEMEKGVTYYWQIIAKDEHGASTAGPVWHFTTITWNDAPGIPNINGPSSGMPGTSYSYTFIAVDPDGDDVFYEIDWGDGDIIPWDGPYESNTLINKDHTWSGQGTFTIRARAKDIYDAVGDWAELSVTMPRNRAITLPFLKFLENHPILYQLLLRFLQL